VRVHAIRPMKGPMLLLCYLIHRPSKIRVVDMHAPHLCCELSHVGMRSGELTRHVGLLLGILAPDVRAEVGHLSVDRREPLVHRVEPRLYRSAQLCDVFVHSLH